MKRSSYEQFAIVRSDSAPLFEKQLNEKMFELRENYPEVKFSDSIPLYAQIKYRVETIAPETISEEFEMVGACFVCEQCPYFVPATNKDGSEDLRCKVGDCTHPDNELGRAYKTSPACDHLYELIQKREVKLCFTK